MRKKKGCGERSDVSSAKEGVEDAICNDTELSDPTLIPSPYFNNLPPLLSSFPPSLLPSSPSLPPLSNPPTLTHIPLVLFSVSIALIASLFPSLCFVFLLFHHNLSRSNGSLTVFGQTYSPSLQLPCFTIDYCSSSPSPSPSPSPTTNTSPNIDPRCSFSTTNLSYWPSWSSLCS